MKRRTTAELTAEDSETRSGVRNVVVSALHRRGPEFSEGDVMGGRISRKRRAAAKPASSRQRCRAATAPGRRAEGGAKFVYAFGGGAADGNATMKKLLGGKGANLAEMAELGLPVPPGFTITTEVCT